MARFERAGPSAEGRGFRSVPGRSRSGGACRAHVLAAELLHLLKAAKPLEGRECRPPSELVVFVLLVAALAYQVPAPAE